MNRRRMRLRALAARNERSPSTRRPRAFPIIIMPTHPHVACALFSAVLLIAPACAGEAPSERAPSQAQERAPERVSPSQPPAPSPAQAESIPDIRLEPVFTGINFTRPIWLTHAGDGTDRIFVIEQPGRIRVFENRPDVNEAGTFLDIRERVFMGHNEEGLLAFTFHPKYADNGRLYVYYSAGDRRDRRTVLSRFRVTGDDPNRADPDSEEIILEIDQPWGNHNGGTVLFGPDGYLYLSIGDGGHAGDPRSYSQNLSNLLGTIIRIDVDHDSSSDETQAGAEQSDAPGPRTYTIPQDNPFIDREGARPEIYAYGLRNVWRMSFDRETGTLWAGDVGQNEREWIHVIRKGENYGWNIMEGTRPFRAPRDGEPADPIVEPIVDHGRREAISITGGYVYRGSAPGNESLQGTYIYGDYGTGRIWGIRYDAQSQRMTAHREIFTPEARNRPYIASFGEDEAGEIYICAFDQYDGRSGRIFRVVAR